MYKRKIKHNFSKNNRKKELKQVLQQKNGVITKLMNISNRVENYVYKKKSIKSSDAEKYLKELDETVISCSNDVRILQVREKLKRQMKFIIEENKLNQNTTLAGDFGKDINKQEELPLHLNETTDVGDVTLSDIQGQTKTQENNEITSITDALEAMLEMVDTDENSLCSQSILADVINVDDYSEHIPTDNVENLHLPTAEPPNVSQAKEPAVNEDELLKTVKGKIGVQKVNLKKTPTNTGLKEKNNNNKNRSRVNNVLSWLSNIKFVRDVKDDEYEINNLPESFWCDYTLPDLKGNDLCLDNIFHEDE